MTKQKKYYTNIYLVYKELNHIGWLSLCIFLIFILAGCKVGQKDRVTLTPLPSATSNSSDLQITPPQLTPVNQFTPTPELEVEIIQNTSLYSHPQNLFSLQAPDDWKLTEDAHSATFTDTEEESIIHVDVVNTGYPMDSESFVNLINAREKKEASEYEIYVEIDRQQVRDTNAYLIIKQLSNLTDRRTLASLYQQQGQAILILDFLVEQDLFDRYQDFMNELINSVNLNADSVSSLSVYSFDQAQLHSNGYFSILIPPYWNLEHTVGDNSMVDTITSPDQLAIIQTIVYDDGQHVTKTIAAELVLTMLRENYTKKITVQSDQILPDGREQLVWRPTTANYHGVTTFEIHGSGLLVLTVMWSNDPDQLYQNILEEVITSYKAVVPGE